MASQTLASKEASGQIFASLPLSHLAPLHWPLCPTYPGPTSLSVPSRGLPADRLPIPHHFTGGAKKPRSGGSSLDQDQAQSRYPD